MRIRELLPNFLAPITAGKMITLSAVAIVFKNAGNATVTLNSFFTLLPGETFQIGSGDDRHTIITGNFQITFGAGSTPRLELFELQPNDKEFSNYEQA
jgi:hypothetical protein